ncbi:hypothetical protein LSTR_LSTR014321 [Laodelphax striatellus]|uniref:Uncharacterized protein n=1 Tax=Laodelphax striatellus TaxID=195883 RepID=A0A482X4N0_LAOST|nr:hypothetical protein LSTR_LSTR014321 [Laodelphax striatellus]
MFGGRRMKRYDEWYIGHAVIAHIHPAKIIIVITRRWASLINEIIRRAPQAKRLFTSDKPTIVNNVLISEATSG